VDAETQHLWKPVHIGQVREDGQFDLVWTSKTPLRPVPFPSSRPVAEWEQMLVDLQRGWGGAWANPGG
jgi:urea transport system substrate-binding protein